MALNYSHRPIFRSYISEDNNVGHGGGSSEKDINDILPDDPFGMDISSTVTAITGWLEDLGVSEYGGCRGEEVGAGKGNGNYPIFGGVNVWLNTGLNTVFGNDKTIGRFGGDDCCIRYGCCAMEDVVFGCGSECVRGGKNVGSYKSRVCGFGEIVVEETLKRVVDDGCSRGSKNLERYKSKECEFREFGMDEMLTRLVDDGCALGSNTSRDIEVTVKRLVDDGCSWGSLKNVESYKSRDMEVTLKRFVDDGYARCSKNVECYKKRDGGCAEFVMEEALKRIVDDGGCAMEDGVENVENHKTKKDDIFGGSDINVHKDKNLEGESVDDTNDGSPHPAMSFALAYLGIRDLLTVERVCKSLRFTVQNDTLLWKSIQIDHPLNTRVTDAILLHLTNRAQGHLQCLSLLECNFVTNDGLRRVLETNLRLTKLSVPGCINIKIEGIIDCLKSFQPRAITGIKRLRVAGRPVTREQFEELMLLLGIQKHVKDDHQKPYFYYRGNIDLSCEDDRPIDLEICPKCEMVKLIYDCTTENCRANDRTTHSCRACIRCINRCFQCGRCIDGVVHEEDFFFDYVCSDCLPNKLKCLDGHEFGTRSSSEQSG